MSKTPAKTESGFTREKNPLGVNISDVEGVQDVAVAVGALGRIFGTDHEPLANALFLQCYRALAANEVRDDNPAFDSRTFMIEAVAGIAPRDAVESMLAVQMAATHVALIRVANNLAYAKNLPQFEAYERGYNKLARTYTAQMEALRKHRNGGNQTVTVQHVNVADGGQAIVGNVQSGGGRGSEEK